MAITEIANAVLAPGTDVKSPGEARDIIENVVNTAKKQEGCLSLGYGSHVENAEHWELLAEWKDIEDHQRFMAMPEYGPFLERAMSITTGGPDSLALFHAAFRTPLDEVIAAPVVEMITAYLPLDTPDNASEVVQTFLDILAKNASGFVKATHGWIVEELEWPEKFEGKAKGYQLAIGWDSVEKHMEYRETDAFKESVPALRALVKAMKMHHTSFTIAS